MLQEEEGKTFFGTGTGDGDDSSLSSMCFYVVAAAGTIFLGWFCLFRGKETSGAEDVGVTERSLVGRSLRTTKRATGLDGRVILFLFVMMCLVVVGAVAWHVYGNRSKSQVVHHEEYDIENQYRR